MLLLLLVLRGRDQAYAACFSPASKGTAHAEVHIIPLRSNSAWSHIGFLSIYIGKARSSQRCSGSGLNRGHYSGLSLDNLLYCLIKTNPRQNICTLTYTDPQAIIMFKDFSITLDLFFSDLDLIIKLHTWSETESGLSSHQTTPRSPSSFIV